MRPDRKTETETHYSAENKKLKISEK